MPKAEIWEVQESKEKMKRRILDNNSHGAQQGEQQKGQHPSLPTIFSK